MAESNYNIDEIKARLSQLGKRKVGYQELCHEMAIQFKPNWSIAQLTQAINDKLEGKEYKPKVTRMLKSDYQKRAQELGIVFDESFTVAQLKQAIATAEQTVNIPIDAADINQNIEAEDNS